jgi:hypothetical protein
MRRNDDLLNRINLICPVQSCLKKYSRSRLTQITSISAAIPSHRGAFRDRHGRWARDAVDAAALGTYVIAGRVDKIRERSNGALTRDVAADGEVVWS